MNRKELGDDLYVSLRTMVDGSHTEVWTCLPGIINSFDPSTQTATVQCALTFSRVMPDQSEQRFDMPLLVDCPVLFPSGGGFTLTFPIAKGDECLVSFADRCIDAWWQSGGVQPQAEFRVHDLSDGFVEVGPRSKPKVIGNVSTTSAELRSDDGSTFVRLAPNGLLLQQGAASLGIAGGVVSITGGLMINGKPYSSHAHTNVSNGGGISGGVAP